MEHHRSRSGQDQSQARDQAARHASKLPSGICSILHRARPRKHHAEGQRVQELFLGQPVSLFHEFAVHERVIRRRSVEIRWPIRAKMRAADVCGRRVMVAIMTTKRGKMGKAFPDAKSPGGTLAFRSMPEMEVVAPRPRGSILPGLSCRLILCACSGRMPCGWKTRPRS